MNRPIYVTQPALPPLDEFNEYLKEIWSNKILTNNGPFHKRFENELTKFLGVKYISLFANGTLALITALQVLKLKGEVITTPFSFVATTHAIWWNRLKPVFADIEPSYLTLDPEKVEKSITSNTSAIMPVHVYGNPCNMDRFEEISKKYGLKLIYDAAHSFGVEINGQSLLNFGDLSVLSFHATKGFNTIEGGAIVCNDEKLKSRVDCLKNFGYSENDNVVEYGYNAKMNEIQSAYGLIQLKYFYENRMKRQVITDLYRETLEGVPGIAFMKDILGINHTYTYFPIFIDEKFFGMTRDELFKELKYNNINVRKYFYPLISRMQQYKNLKSAKGSNLPIAEKFAQQVLCLPIYPNLELDDVKKISNLIISISIKRSRNKSIVGES